MFKKNKKKKDMTLIEIIEAKNNLEAELTKLINDFEDKNCVLLGKIDIDRNFDKQGVEAHITIYL